jgi:hypothetical protein
MLAYIFYTKDAPHQTTAERLAADLDRHKVESKLIEADSREGIDLAELYGVMSRPSVVLVTQDGGVVSSWSDLPTPSDVSYHAHA